MLHLKEKVFSDRLLKDTIVRRPDGSVGMALVLSALTDCRWWFESLLVHSGVSSATRRKATAPTTKKKLKDTIVTGNSHTIGSNNEHDTPDKRIHRTLPIIHNDWQHNRIYTTRTVEHIHRYVHGNLITMNMQVSYAKNPIQNEARRQNTSSPCIKWFPAPNDAHPYN